MAQTNFTPILTYKSDTASAVPSAGNLTNSANGAELAVNTADKRLFTKDSGGNVVELGTNPSSVTLPNGTANGVVYANGSKVLTTGSALTFDGTALRNTSGQFEGIDSLTLSALVSGTNFTVVTINSAGTSGTTRFQINGSEQMRLTSTGLGIGTSLPTYRFNAQVASATAYSAANTLSADPIAWFYNASSTAGVAATIRLDAGTSGGNAAATISAVHTASGSSALTFGTRNSSSDVTERMRLDSSGNLGLGVTPSAWATFKVMQIGNGTADTFIAVSGNQGDFGVNAYYNAGWKYQTSSVAASRYEQSSGVHQWFTAPSGTAGNAISFTQAMTLDASGNLLVGNTSAFYSTSGRGLVNINGSSTALLGLGIGGTGKGYLVVTSSTTALESESGNDLKLNAIGGNTVQLWTSNTERARIDSSGNLLVGTTSVASTVGNQVGLELRGGAKLAVFCASDEAPLYLARRTSDGAIAQFRRDTTSVGSISVTTTATAYNTSSDYRLKEDIQPMTGALAKVAALKPCTYKWKADGSDGEGFIAHELQAVVPQCVTGEKDAVDAEGKPVYQGIDTSFLVATLAAALQEAHGLIKDLQARVDALEAK